MEMKHAFLGIFGDFNFNQIFGAEYGLNSDGTKRLENISEGSLNLLSEVQKAI
jgi:hypothetical protein